MRDLSKKTFLNGRYSLAELIIGIVADAVKLSLWLGGFTLVLWLVLITIASQKTGQPVFNFFPDFVR